MDRQYHRRIHLPAGSRSEIYAVGTYSYRSGAFVASDFTNSGYNFQHGYGLTNLRAGIRLGDHWDVSIFSDNIFNTTYATSKSTSNTLYYTSTQSAVPRTYGVTARFSL